MLWCQQGQGEAFFPNNWQGGALLGAAIFGASTMLQNQWYKKNIDSLYKKIKAQSVHSWLWTINLWMLRLELSLIEKSLHHWRSSLIQPDDEPLLARLKDRLQSHLQEKLYQTSNIKILQNRSKWKLFFSLISFPLTKYKKPVEPRSFSGSGSGSYVLSARVEANETLRSAPNHRCVFSANKWIDVSCFPIKYCFP